MGLLSWLTRATQGLADQFESRAVNITNYDQYQGVQLGVAMHDQILWAMRTGTLVHGPGATELMREAQGGDSSNSLVRACLRRLATDFSQVPPQMMRHTGPDQQDPIPDHALTRLLSRPNQFISGQTLRWWTGFVLGVHGNAYWRKIRAGDALGGNVVELWPVSPEKMHPVTYRGSGDFISAYRYYRTPNDYEDVPIANIVHFRVGLDDLDHRLGLSQLRDIVRAVATDDVATRFTYNLLSNGAIPGTMVMLDKDVTMDPQQAEMFKAEMEQRFGGENQGRTMVLQGATKAERMGFSPSDLDLAPLSGLPESRICAIFGVPPQVVGAKIGLEHATYSNYDQAAESYTELTLLPSLTSAAETLNLQLVPDFTANRNELLRFDTGGLRALAEDEDALTTRVVAQWAAGLVKKDEARTKLGYDPLGGAEGESFGGVAQMPTTPPDAPQTPPEALAAPKALRLAQKAGGAAATESLLLVAREQAIRETERAVETYQQGQRRRVISKVEAEA